MAITGARGSAGATARDLLIARRRDASGKFDLAATGGGTGNGTYPSANLGYHDARSRLATQLARLIDRLLERRFHAFREFLQGLGERPRLDFEPERQHARGRQELRLPREQYRAQRIGRAVDRDRRQAADAAGAAIGEHVLA